MIPTIWLFVALGFGFVFGERNSTEQQRKQEKDATLTRSAYTAGSADLDTQHTKAEPRHAER